MTTHALIGSANDLSPLTTYSGSQRYPSEAAERFETWGGSSFTQPYAYPYPNFPKCSLRCSLAQAIFTVFSVSVIDAMHQQAVVQAVLLHCASQVVHCASQVVPLLRRLCGLKQFPLSRQSPRSRNKECLPLVLGPLTKIINCSLLTSIFPAASKKAAVIPLKKGDDEVASNNRSLSFLAVASKICEKIVLNQFSSYLTNNNRSSSHQSGNLLKLSVFILPMPYWKEWKTRQLLL